MQTKIILAALVVAAVGGLVAAGMLSSKNNDSSMTDGNTAATSTTADAYEANPVAVFETNLETFEVELQADKMPVTAGNFVKLAKAGFYDGTRFHRVIDGFMIQGGDPLSKDLAQAARWGTGGPGYAIEDEFVAGQSNVRGTISMANSGPNSGGSQFFINLVDNTYLDFDNPMSRGKHPVFGKVVSGLDVVDKIGGVETLPGDRPAEDVVIQKVTIK